MRRSTVPPSSIRAASGWVERVSLGPPSRGVEHHTTLTFYGAENKDPTVEFSTLENESDDDSQTEDGPTWAYAPLEGRRNPARQGLLSCRHAPPGETERAWKSQLRSNLTDRVPFSEQGTPLSDKPYGTFLGPLVAVVRTCRPAVMAGWNLLLLCDGKHTGRSTVLLGWHCLLNFG